MDRKIFDKHKADCKKGWEELAITGDKNKPKALLQYYQGCPACALSIIANKEIKNDPYSHELNCRLCPVDRWRNAAKANPHSCDGGNNHGIVGCESCDPGGPWEMWRSAQSFSDHRKKFAKMIAGLRWTYLQVYENKGDE